METYKHWCFVLPIPNSLCKCGKEKISRWWPILWLSWLCDSVCLLHIAMHDHEPGAISGLAYPLSYHALHITLPIHVPYTNINIYLYIVTTPRKVSIIPTTSGCPFQQLCFQLSIFQFWEIPQKKMQGKYEWHQFLKKLDFQM